MNIVTISAGLGNQIFQYAFFRALKKNNADTKMDISDFAYRKHHNGYELEKIFNIIPDYATRKECNALADLSKDLWSDIRRKFLKIHLKCYGKIVKEDIVGYKFHPDILNYFDTFFVGFWQSEKYFKSIEKELREELTFKGTLDSENQKIADKILSGNSVSIHIRRGDYVKARRTETWNVCSLDYYKRAIEYIEANSNNPQFFIFSDDMQWVKDNLPNKNFTYVDNNKGSNSFRDMQLMSLCKHNIIANSSFSWWAAWLNASDDKIVIAPSIWFRHEAMPDVIPDNWVRINVD